MLATPGLIGAAATTIARDWPGFYWSFGPGKLSEDEPMWGVVVFDPTNPETVVAQAEDEDPMECVKKLRRQTSTNKKDQIDET